jgi:hypothetical protein
MNRCESVGTQLPFHSTSYWSIGMSIRQGVAETTGLFHLSHRDHRVHWEESQLFCVHCGEPTKLSTPSTWLSQDRNRVHEFTLIIANCLQISALSRRLADKTMDSWTLRKPDSFHYYLFTFCTFTVYFPYATLLYSSGSE